MSAPIPDSTIQAAMHYVPYKKKVLITGGTKGIGRAVIEELGRLQCNILTCSRNQQDLDELLESCKNEGWTVDGVVADVSTSEGRILVAQKANEYFNGNLDVLINNVGTNIRLPTVEFTEEHYSKVFSTNLESALFLSQACFEMLKASSTGQGVIIMNSSVAGGPTAMKSGVLYGMTKAALNHLCKYLGCEWSEHGIRVVGVAPWYTATPLAMQVLKDKAYLDKVMERTPAKRVGEPAEVARTISFLSSPAASYITAAVVPVDGGYSAMGFW